MMTSRERVLATFAHEEPDCVPRWCGATPGFIAKAKQQLGIAETELLWIRFGDDFRRVQALYAGPDAGSPDRNLSPGATYRSRFGIERHGFGYGVPLTHPLAAATLKEVHAYPWPDPAWMEVSRIREEALAWGRRYAILGGDWSPYWHDAIDLLGMEGLLLKILFNGAIDSHHVLIEGTPASVRQSVREVLSILAPGGGYIAGASHDYLLEETPVDNVVAMFNAVEEFGRYPITTRT